MAVKPSQILGMNSRHVYTKQNPWSAKRFGFSKIRTKKLLIDNGIPCAQILHVVSNLHDLDKLKWEEIPTPFVLKPASGSAGKGIWIISRKIPNKLEWKNQENDTLTLEDLNLHVRNILDGEFSTWNAHHKAIIEELIPPHPALAKLAYKGTPDLRIIVFNSVPVMAMARIPTKESEGKANLDRGAIGLGIDIATGTTTYGLKGKKQRIYHFPNSKRKVSGIKIPFWREALETAVKAANAAGYKYMGADIFVHPERGPMIVELNGYPGLSIQLTNKAGLKRRLERVEGLDVRDAKHGVRIGQALFSESFGDQRLIEEGVKVISTKPKLMIKGEDNHWHETISQVNTVRNRSAISEELAQKLGLLDIDDLLWQQESKEGKVPVIEVKAKLKDHSFRTGMIVSKRLNKTAYKVELGRNDIQGFLVGDVEL